ncbi:MAG: hypothetical protein RBU30_13530 [Polyangia bacterium]|nr:hypothetical protein [Polyangia bacterium]
MTRLALLGCCFLVFGSCKKQDDDPSGNTTAPITAMRANLKNAVLIALVAGAGGQQASRTGAMGVMKDGRRLCEDLTVEELTEVDGQGAYVNACDNPDPLSYCQDIDPDKLATGRVECTTRPWVAGDLVAVDHDGEVFSVLPSLPSWNQVTRVQRSEGALLVTLAKPVKLLLSDQTTDLCHVLYYAIDTTSDSIVPYCYAYDYWDAHFCFGPEKAGDEAQFRPYVPVSGEECPIEETLTTQDDATQVVCIYESFCAGDKYWPRGEVHVTPYALFEPFWLNDDPGNGQFTRIVAGDQEAFYPLEIHFYSTHGIISALEYYTFDASHQSLSGLVAGAPMYWAEQPGKHRVFESGPRILYGFGTPEAGTFASIASTAEATLLPLAFFDTETMEDGSFLIDLTPHPQAGAFGSDKQWFFMASIGDYLFIREAASTGTNLWFSVDVRDPRPILAPAYQNDNTSAMAADLSVVMNGYAVNYSTRNNSALPFVAYLMRPDGSVSEINAAMLGFNPQDIVIEDDQIVVTGMSGLTPRRFVISPLASGEGELLVETPTESIPARTLIPLEQASAPLGDRAARP